MRIVSNFHDYYDSIRGYGSDPRLVYVRETKEVEPDKYLANPLINAVCGMPRWDYGKTGAIAFCGRIFPFYTYEDKAAYGLQDLKKLVALTPTFSLNNAKDILKGLQRQEVKKRTWHSKWWSSYGRLSETLWESYLDRVDLSINDDFFRNLHAPVVLFEKTSNPRSPLVLNPRLNKYNFATQKDPYTAYQELSMFLGNNMATQMDPEVHVSDVIKAESHGFDKWSFRKKGKGK